MRPATAADLDAILDIEGRWPTTPHWNREQFASELAGTRPRFLVAEEEGRVIGYAVCWIVAGEAELLNLAVHPERARGGVGRGLLAAAMRAAAAEDCSKMTLEVSARNAPAVRLYESAGFRVVGRRAKYYNDGADALLMDARLDLRHPR